MSASSRAITLRVLGASDSDESDSSGAAYDTVAPVAHAGPAWTTAGGDSDGDATARRGRDSSSDSSSDSGVDIGTLS